MYIQQRNTNLLQSHYNFERFRTFRLVSEGSSYRSLEDVGNVHVEYKVRILEVSF